MQKLLVSLAMLALLAQPALAQQEGATPAAPAQAAPATDAAAPADEEEGYGMSRPVQPVPVRIITLPISVLQGIGHQTAVFLNNVSERTFLNIVDPDEDGDNNAGASLVRSVVLVPAGVAGTAVAIPAGVLTGTVVGLHRGLTRGFDTKDLD